MELKEKRYYHSENNALSSVISLNENNKYHGLLKAYRTNGDLLLVFIYKNDFYHGIQTHFNDCNMIEHIVTKKHVSSNGIVISINYGE